MLAQNASGRASAQASERVCDVTPKPLKHRQYHADINVYSRVAAMFAAAASSNPLEPHKLQGL